MQARQGAASKNGVTGGITSGYSISQPRAEQNQNMSFSANWICREVVAVVLMTPAEEL
jgi:hypothetical protein